MWGSLKAAGANWPRVSAYPEQGARQANSLDAEPWRARRQVSANQLRLLRVWALALLSAVVGMAGCRTTAPPPASPGPLVVPVALPVRREVTDFIDYTGRLDAVQSLDVRARVTGYLVQMPFKEGSEVKAGQLLFEIDPRPYQAQVDAAKAQLALTEANYRLAKAENQRSIAIARRDAGAISAEELERYAAQEAQAQASLGVARANLESAELYLNFTKVTSPIDGRVSRYYYTLGNLVSADQTLLTTVVSLDPIYAYFDMDERTILRIREMINQGKIQVPADQTNIPIYMGLEGQVGFPLKGTFDFANNTVNPTTGTVAVRAVFANPLPPNGRRLLMPGMFVRIRVPVGGPHPALLVIDRALGSNQGIKFAYVVNGSNAVEYRRVATGPLEDDGLRVVESGLTADDWVVIGALQQVRERMQVEPERMAMPTLGASAEQGGEPARGPQPPPPGEKGTAGKK